MRFRLYYRTILYAMQGLALIFAVLAFLFLILSLCDLFIGLGWGYNWWAPVLALAQMAVGFTVNRVAAIALRRL
jgi:hypothetical protein